MSTTITRPDIKPGRRAAAPDMRLDPVGSRRRPALAVGSIALVVACLAVFVSVYLKAGSQVSVLAVARTVPQGQILTANDLTTVRVSVGSRIETVSAADAASVVGHRAAELLEPDTLLTTDELVTSFAPPAGESVVGVALKDGQLPASGVAPGETVEVILTGLPGEQDSTVIPESTGTDQSATAAAATAASAAAGDRQVRPAPFSSPPPSCSRRPRPRHHRRRVPLMCRCSRPPVWRPLSPVHRWLETSRLSS
jgi:hypothetical protein